MSEAHVGYVAHRQWGMAFSLLPVLASLQNQLSLVKE